MVRVEAAAAILLLCPVVTFALERGALLVQVLRSGEPAAGVLVQLGIDSTTETDRRGVATFRGLEPGTYALSVDGLESRVVVTSEVDFLTLDLEAPLGVPERFGRSTLDREDLEAVPHAGTLSSVLETLDPFAVTDRLDVAGIESGTDPLWGVRGSSWTQNRVLLDGADLTDPAGGASLFFPDVFFHEQITLSTSANPTSAAGPGAEIQLVSRHAPDAFGGTFVLRYSGSALQSENLNDELIALGVEPRELLRFPAVRLSVGAPRFYGAVNGFQLGRRIPRFEPQAETSHFSGLGKLQLERWSLLGAAQRRGHSDLGAAPGIAAEATVEARESSQIALVSFAPDDFLFRASYARKRLDSIFAGTGSPLRDLAREELQEAPSLVTDRTAQRWTAHGASEWTLSGHLVRAGVELSRAREEVRESVPGARERLTVDGSAQAVSFFSGSGARDATATRLALHAQDAFFFQALGRHVRLSPGLRLDVSRSGPLRWASLSGALLGGVGLTPSTAVHFSIGRYPHHLTTRLHAASQGLSWTRLRWTDANGDLEATPEEVGGALRRGGGGYTAIEDDLPRPVTDELTIGIEKHFERGFLRFSGYQRWERGLLATVNTGIAPSSYDSFPFLDVGVDGVLGTADDREIPVFDQTAQLGEDSFLLTHPPGLGALAQGVDLLLGFDHGRLSWRLSGRAYRDVGRGNVGNEAQENDTGVPGNLFDDPNTLTSSEGRLFFDRAFTGKLALTALGPREIEIGCAIRYWDGQPFARHLFFPDLGQGFVIVQAFPRGRLRYAFNMTVDVRLAREIVVGPARVGLAVELFNVFNQTLHTEENVRSGPSFRDQTLVQPARTIVLEGRLRF